jgi:hypothetical protein
MRQRAPKAAHMRESSGQECLRCDWDDLAFHFVLRRSFMMDSIIQTFHERATQK